MRECFIYKITSIKNKIYIGSTYNIKKRLNDYKNLYCKKQTKLYNSLKKYGFENHKFEIIENCFQNNRNERESFWGKFYDVLGKNGLNLSLPKQKNYPSCSEETKAKMSKIHKGKIINENCRKLSSERMIGKKYALGYKFTEEQRKKHGEERKGVKS